MDNRDMIIVLQSSATQWLDYLEEGKQYGHNNLEVDLEIADIKRALMACDTFMESSTFTHNLLALIKDLDKLDAGYQYTNRKVTSFVRDYFNLGYPHQDK